MGEVAIAPTGAMADGTGGMRPLRARVEALLLSVVLSAFVAWYGELFHEAIVLDRTGVYAGLLDGAPTARVLLRMAALFVVALAICGLALRFGRRALHLAYRRRYVIAGVFVVVWTLASLNMSSIGFMASVLSGEPSGVVFGIPRGIRSDEWVVTTPLTLSQEANGFAPVSPILMGANVTLVYNLPSWSPVTLFRPFQWPSLLLGVERGTSLSAGLAPIVCLLLSFEVAMRFVRSDAWLSALFAAIVSLSPFSMWWGVSQFVVYGEALVLSLAAFLHARSLGGKMAFALLIAWLCGCYFFLLYPAWMVPYFYVFALMGVQVVVGYVHEVHTTPNAPSLRHLRGGLVAIAACVTVAALLVGVGLYLGWDSVAKTMNTVYPGNRMSSGGEVGNPLRPFLYGPSLFYAITSEGITGNASEMSALFSLFPFGLAGALWAIATRRRRDVLLVSFVVLDLAFLSYCLVPWPQALTRLTLMSFVPSGRLIGPMGYLDAMLLVCVLRCVCDTSPAVARHARKARRAARWQAPVVEVLVAGALTVVLVVLFRAASGTYLRIILTVPLVLVSFGCIYLLVRCVTTHSKRYVRGLVGFMGAVLVVSGCCVNPIQHGMGVLTDSALWHAVQAVLATPASTDGKHDNWLTTGSLITQNVCAAAGAPVVNSVNMVPRLELWHIIDPDATNEDLYNRYCHVVADVVDGPTEFRLVQADYVELDLSYEDLERLGIGYLVAIEPPADAPDHGVTFQLVAEGNGYGIYQVNYADTT